VNNPLVECFEALKRLQNSSCVRIPNNSKINMDNVAAEAGLYRGFIRRSNTKFKLLIDMIDNSTSTAKLKPPAPSRQLAALKKDVAHYRSLYEQGLARELAQLTRIAKLEKLLKQSANSNIVEFKPLKKQ
jgi:hypothetical protein